MDKMYPMIKCKKCGITFAPDMKTRLAWPCPSCKANNPNLKRHYRSVADLCILGFIVTLLMVLFDLNDSGFKLGLILPGLYTVFLLGVSLMVYRSRMPWTDSTAKALIWTVFIISIPFNFIIAMMLARILFIPVIVAYAFIFLYLIWLNAQTNICTATEPPPLPVNEES